MIRPTGNLTLGDGGHNYITHNQTVYTEKSLKGIGRANALQSGNIVNGFHDVDYQLSSNEYGSKQGESNKLPKEVLAGMKNTNIVHDGGKSFEGDTTYHVEYGWKTGER